IQTDRYRGRGRGQERDQRQPQVLACLGDDAAGAGPVGRVQQPLPDRGDHARTARNQGVSSRVTARMSRSNTRASSTQPSTPITIGPIAEREKPSVNSSPSWETPMRAATETIEMLLTAATRSPAEI